LVEVFYPEGGLKNYQVKERGLTLSKDFSSNAKFDASTYLE